MTTLAVQPIVEAGLEPVYSAAAALGDTFLNDGSERIFIEVIDANDGVVVTVAPDVSSTTKPGFGALTKPDMVVTIGAAETRKIGPFPLTAFGVNPDIQYNDEANVTIGVFRI